MYIPAHFKNRNIPEIVSFIRKNSFGMLMTLSGNKPLVTHIPIELAELEGNYVLRGHVSRVNPQAETFSEGGQALAIFTGPHAYISSSWYSHMNVPTWNYIAVHVSGPVRKMTNDELLHSLDELMHKYEQSVSKPMSMKDVPEEMVVSYLKGITGFEISVESIEGKWKMSQNRNDADYLSVIRELESLDPASKEVAGEMKKIRPL